MTSKRARKVLTYFAISMVAIISAINYELFVFPNKFAPAGLNGICTMIQYITGISVGYMALAINIPLAIITYLKVSKSLALRSMTYVAVSSIAMVVLDGMDLSRFAYSTDTGNILYPAWSNYNDKIRKVVIQGNGINLGNGIFYNCNLLEEIVFEGSAPDLSESAFFGVDATIHYPASFYGWTADLLDHYDGSVEWKPYGMTQLKITQQPTLRQARSADNLTISVSAEGDGLSYCWYAKDAEHDIFVKTSVTGSVYTVNAGTQDRQVMCIVSDQHGNWIQSDIVLIPAIEI